MGLDVLAAKDGKVIGDPDLEALDVIRGIFTLKAADSEESGSGIRGKVYAQFLADDNELSLYDELTPEQCGEVAAEFRAHAERLPVERAEGDGGWTRNDVEQAARWFQICADKGYGTIAWY